MRNGEIYHTHISKVKALWLNSENTEAINMKKIIAIALTLAMAVCATACGKDGDDNTSSAAPVNSQVSSQQTEVSEPEEESPEPVTIDSPDVSSEEENTLGEWKTTDFENYGISDFEKFDLGEMIYYTATYDGGITVMWEGVTDMDAITAYGESLFDKTAEMGGNYTSEFDEDAIKWVLASEYASFSDACRAWTYDYYYSDWFYEYNGDIIMVAYYGESELLTLKVYFYSAA